MYIKDYLNLTSYFIHTCCFFLLIVVYVLLPVRTVSATNINIEEDYLSYTENENGTLTVTGYDRTKHAEPYNLSIHNSYNGKTVTAIADRLFKEYSFESISIDNNIAIGSHSFEKTTVSTVSIGTDSTGSNHIGTYAFAQADITTRITILSQVFYDNCCFKFATFGDGQVHQPEPNTTHIGDSAFENSNYSSGINCDAVISIGEGAFRRSNLKEFTISPTMQTIGKEAFSFPVQYSDKPVYSNIYIDPLVDSIEGFHLEDMTAVFFHVDANSPVIDYLSSHNMLFYLANDNEDSTSPAYIGQILEENDCMVTINGEDTATLLSITYDEEVLTLDKCFDITYHGHTYSINTLAESCFDGRNCPYLKKLIFGDSITHINSFCFTAMNHVPIEEIVLSNHLEEILQYGIPNQDPLTLVFPAGITSLDNLNILDLDLVVFQIEKDCPFINILIENRITYQFPGEPPLSPDDPGYLDNKIPTTDSDDSGSTGTDSPADSGCSGSTDTGSPADSDNSGSMDTNSQANSDSSGSTGTDSPADTSGSGSSGTTSTKTSITKLSSFTKNGLIYKVTGTYAVTFTKPVRKNITKLTIPSYITYQGIRYNVTKIEKKACYKCSRLKTVTIGGNVTSIGDYAFARCSNLKSISFGKNIKTLGKKVLYYDKKLSTIKFQGTKLQSIGKQTFRKVPKTVSIIVPNAKVSKYKRLINNAK